jgi:hypothetical protein
MRRARLETGNPPCQIGGGPVCAESGCIASVGVSAIKSLRLARLIQFFGFSFCHKELAIVFNANLLRAVTP